MKTDVDLLEAVNERLRAAQDRLLSLRSGTDGLTVQRGDTNLLLELPPVKLPLIEEESVVNESPIRFQGRTLRVEDSFNGSVAATESLTEGSYFLYGFGTEAVDVEFENGVLTVPNVRRTEGGLLVWTYTLQLSLLTSPQRVQVLFRPEVVLRSLPLTGWPAADPVTVSVGSLSDEASLSTGTTTGTVHQLCGVYGRDGRVTIYRRRPGVRDDVGSLPKYNNGFFNVV